MKRDARLSLPARDGGDWEQHLAAVYNIEFNQLGIAISVTVTAAPIILGFLYSLPDSLEDIVYLGLPLAPLSIALFYAYIFLNSRMVGKYARALEREMAALGSPRTTRYSTQLFFPALSRLNGALYGGESRRLAPFRLVFILFATTVLFIQFFTIFYLIHKIKDSVLEGVGYGVYSFLILVALSSFLFGGSHVRFEELKHAVLLRDWLKSNEQFVHQNSWGRYIREALLPRPLSLSKALDVLFVASITLLVMWGQVPLGMLATSIGLAAVATFIVFDVVLYQTRYFLNASREGTLPGLTLPGDYRNNSRLPWTAFQRILTPLIAGARVYLFILLCERYSLMSASTAYAIVGLFFVVFYAYEIPREFARRAARKLLSEAYSEGSFNDSEVDALSDSQMETINKGATEFLRGRAPMQMGWLLFFAVGGGYALRWGVFLAIFNDKLITSWFGITLILAAWAYGSAQVSAGWVVEMQGAISRPGANAQVISVSAGLVSKPQLVWAATAFGANRGNWVAGHVPLTNSKQTEPVAGWWMGAWTRRAPWTAAALVGSALGLLACSLRAEVTMLRIFSSVCFLILFFYVSSIMWRRIDAKRFGLLRELTALQSESELEKQNASVAQEPREAALPEPFMRTTTTEDISRFQLESIEPLPTLTRSGQPSGPGRIQHELVIITKESREEVVFAEPPVRVRHAKEPEAVVREASQEELSLLDALKSLDREVGLTTLLFAVLGGLAPLAPAWSPAIFACIIAVWLPFAKLNASQVGNFATLVASFERFTKILKSSVSWLARVLTSSLVILVGYPVVHAFAGRFRSRRSGWV